MAEIPAMLPFHLAVRGRQMGSWTVDGIAVVRGWKGHENQYTVLGPWVNMLNRDFAFLHSQEPHSVT